MAWSHDSISVPIITAGSAGGSLRTGQYVDYRNLAQDFGWADHSDEQAMGLPPSAYESGPYGGYGEHFIGEGRESYYPSSVLDVQGQWLPWLQA